MHHKVTKNSMFRPITSQDYHPPPVRAPIPQRVRIVDEANFVTPASTTRQQQQQENDNAHFLSMSVVVPATTDELQRNAFPSTTFVALNKPSRPDTPKTYSYTLPCSPLTVCSDTRRHSPPSFPNSNSDFVPIGHKVVAPAPLPLSQVLKNKSSYETSGESAYHPYASPSPISRTLPSPTFTVDTCSVTTHGTDRTTTLSTTRLRSPSLSPYYAKQVSRPASSLAIAAGWCVPTNLATRTTSINVDRPKSAPTLPTAASGNDERKIRLKTELCMHYENGRLCPFGSNCTYAHGPEELQMTKLQDLHDAGLVDQATYRTKPCLTWIMCGSCPFGKRCASIHDSRVSSTLSSWLPHTETQGNTIATDINVDGLFQKRLYEILFDNPLGDQFDLQEAMKCPESAFERLYGLVCGEANPKREGSANNKTGRSNFHRRYNKENGTASNKSGGIRGLKTVHPIYKLQIALKLRGDADWHYKYRPQHVVHDELCMVLQKKAYRVISNDTTKSLLSSKRSNRSIATAISSVQEIPLIAYNPKHDGHILVHEIAFGPDSDPSVRGAALWFNIDEDNVTLCTPQQAKRFRWKKSMPMAATKPVTTKFDEQSSTNGKVSVFDSRLESIPMIRPHDEAAFCLVTDILKHRLAVLKRERMASLKDRFDHLRKLEYQKKIIRDERFVPQLYHWVTWAWPINAGREHVDVHTPVPPVEGPYCLAYDKKEEDPKSGQANQTANMVKGVHVHRIWDSFVEQFPTLNVELQQERSNGTPFGVREPRRRLTIFQDLADGKEIDKKCRALPHILKHRAMNTMSHSTNNSSKKCKAGVNPSSRHQERCWKALMVLPENGTDNNETVINNEWSLVRQHFSQSRSHKVLTILQQ